MCEEGAAQSPVSELGVARRIGRNYRGPTRVAFVVNNDWWFLSHRASWGEALKAAGAAVTVIAEDTGKANVLRKMGFDFIDIHVGRESSSVLTMVKSAVQILLALLRLRPDVVFLTAQAAYTLGWPASLILRRTAFVRVVSGTGRALTPSALKTPASKVVQIAARITGRLHNMYTLFQVEQDRQVFISLGLLPFPERSLLLGGTGIVVDSWRGGDEFRDFEHPVILFASRLFREKGIYEFVEAAGLLHGRGWRFQIAGEPDYGVASAVTLDEIERWRRRGTVEVLGLCTDMTDVFAKATVFVLPTRHPEGTPRVLIEAGAAGVPSIASSQSGCAAVIDHGVTGLLLGLEPSAQDIAAAVESLASNPSVANAMGLAAREKVTKNFSLEGVLTRLLEWAPLGAVRK